MVYQKFEEEKCKFCKRVTGEFIAIDMPNNILKVYTSHQISENIATSDLQGVTFEDDDMLYFTNEAAEKYLFQDTMDGIISCMRQALDIIDNDVTTIYLVGGFGGCNYVYSKVTEAIRQHELKITLCQLESPHLAVIRGAVLWRKNPDIVKARTVDATYGVLTNISYDTNYNTVHKSYVDNDGDQQMEVFCSFIEKGDLLPTDEVITREFLPRQGSNGIRLRLLSSDKKAIQFPIDDDGKPTVTDIGTIDIAVPNPNNLPREECKVEVTMDFSGTEIQAKAKYVINSEVKIVCDFLSQIEHNE